MEITLTPEPENLVNKKIQLGKYNSPCEVVREGLLLLKREDNLKKLQIEELRGEVQKGIDAIRQGNSKTYSSADEMIEDIISEARAKFEARKTNGK